MRWPEKKFNFPAAVLLPNLSCMCVLFVQRAIHQQGLKDGWKREAFFTTWEGCSIIIASQLWEGSLTACLVTWLSWKGLPVFDTGTSWQSQLGQEGIGDPHHVKLISSEPHKQEHLHPQAKSICHRTSLINQLYGNLPLIKNSIHTM